MIRVVPPMITLWNSGHRPVGSRTFACGGMCLVGFVVILLLIAEQDSRYVEDKSDQIQVCWVRVSSSIDVIRGGSK